MIGAFAGVIHGTAEATDGLDITPSVRRHNPLGSGRDLADLQLERVGGEPLELENAREPAIELATRAADSSRAVLAVPTIPGRSVYLTASSTGV